MLVLVQIIRIYDVKTLKTDYILEGHTNDVSKVVFDCKGYTLITGSNDATCRLWDVDTGECRQILEGHTDEIF